MAAESDGMMGSQTSSTSEPGEQRPRRFSRESLELAALAAEVIGAVAVLITLAFLAVQMADNNRLLESQAYFNFLEVAHHPIAMPVQDPDLHAVLQKCTKTPDEATEDEWDRCGTFYFIVYNSWEYTYYQDGNDALPKGLHIGADAYFRSLLSKPGYQRFWPEYRESYGEPFRSYVEELFIRARASGAPAAENVGEGAGA